MENPDISALVRVRARARETRNLQMTLSMTSRSDEIRVHEA